MVIEEYNPEWPAMFLKIRNTLESSLTKILKIEHLGSTSIKGMCAKPVIDMIIVIEAGNFEKTGDELSQIGYQHEGDLGIPGREAFKRNKTVRDELLDGINHHLYVCDKNNDELKRQILFRDYLNRHEDKMKEYCHIKNEIIKRFGNEDRDKYVVTKASEYKWFFDKMLAEAQAEIG